MINKKNPIFSKKSSIVLWGIYFAPCILFFVNLYKLHPMKKLIFLICCIIFFAKLYAQNVGIGTPIPQDRLEVSGNIRTNGLRIVSNGSIDLGFGIEGKEPNAGRIGYGLFTPNTVDIVGGGTAFSNRSIKFWADGGSTFTGRLLIEGSGGQTGLYLGNGVVGKEVNAGRIGYAITTVNAIDFYGAGSSNANRSIKFWAEGGSTFTGALRLNGASGSYGIFLGNDVVGKEPNAGRIGYGLFTTNAIDIVGGGTSSDTRRIRLWAEGGTEMTGDATIFGNMQINAFTRMGTQAESSPAIKVKKLTGVSQSNQGTVATISHGLNSAKILLVSVLMNIGNAPGDQKIPPNYFSPGGYEYNFEVRSNAIWVINRSGNSGNILNKPLEILIIYEE
jgi:hypothetical protein